MKYQALWTSLSLIFLFFINTEVYSCNVSVSSENGQIIISGLTEDDNTKLFDVDFNSIWECNPWNGTPCPASENITGLEVGTTYFLSVVSDICEEWVPITVENNGPIETCSDGIQNQDETGIDCGGNNCPPCSSGCNINVISTGNTINVSGMNEDVNAKLFDTDFNVIWSCNPWDGNPCSGDINIPNLEEGAYFFSANSDVCQEWIPITIEGGSETSSICEVNLDDWSPVCFVANANGSFTTRNSNSFDTYRENNYSASGELISSEVINFFRANLFMSTDGQITVNTGSSGIPIPSINPTLLNTYTTGNNFFVQYINQLEDLSFYVIGVNVGTLVPSTSGFSDAQLDLTLYHLDSNGNEIESIQFDSFLYTNIGNDISSKFSVRGFIPLTNGGFDLFMSRSYSSGPGWFTTNRTTRHQISSNFSNVETTTEGTSNVNGNSFILNISDPGYCDLYEFSTTIVNSSPSTGSSSNRTEKQYYDYSVAPRKLVYEIGTFSSSGVSGNFSYEFFNYFLDNGESINLSISGDEPEVLPDYIIPTGGNSFNFIVDGVLSVEGNDIDNDGICDAFDCQPTNPNLPTTPGETCNDFNLNTVNDRIQSDGCTCLGEPVGDACDIEVFTLDGGFIIFGLPTDANTKLFDSSGNIVFGCNPWSGTCSDEERTGSLVEGENYFLSVVSEFCQEWIPITYSCNVQFEETAPGVITITGMNNTINAQISTPFESNPPNFGIVWLCGSDSGNNPCDEIEIVELNPGTPYNLNILSCGISESFTVTSPFNDDNNTSRLNAISQTNHIKVNAIFPNPTEHEIFLQLESELNQPISIKVFDAIGKLQFEVNKEVEIGNNTFELNTNHLKQGIYNVQIVNQTKSVITKRFVKI